MELACQADPSSASFKTNKPLAPVPTAQAASFSIAISDHPVQRPAPLASTRPAPAGGADAAAARAGPAHARPRLAAGARHRCDARRSRRTPAGAGHAPAGGRADGLSDRREGIPRPDAARRCPRARPARRYRDAGRLGAGAAAGRCPAPRARPGHGQRRHRAGHRAAAAAGAGGGGGRQRRRARRGARQCRAAGPARRHAPGRLADASGGRTP